MASRMHQGQEGDFGNSSKWVNVHYSKTSSVGFRWGMGSLSASAEGDFCSPAASFAVPVSCEGLSLNVHCGVCAWCEQLWHLSFALSNSAVNPYFSTCCERNCLPFFLASLPFCRCWIRHFNKTKWCVFYKESFETRQDCCTLFKASFQEKPD